MHEFKSRNKDRCPCTHLLLDLKQRNEDFTHLSWHAYEA